MMDDYHRKYMMGHKQGNITDDVYTDAMLPDLYAEMIKLKY